MAVENSTLLKPNTFEFDAKWITFKMNQFLPLSRQSVRLTHFNMRLTLNKIIRLVEILFEVEDACCVCAYGNVACRVFFILIF